MNRLRTSVLAVALAVSPACDFDEYKAANERTEAAADEYSIGDRCLDDLRELVDERADANPAPSVTLATDCLELAAEHPDIVTLIEIERQAEEDASTEVLWILGGVAVAVAGLVLASSRVRVSNVSDRARTSRRGFRPM